VFSARSSFGPYRNTPAADVPPDGDRDSEAQTTNSPDHPVAASASSEQPEANPSDNAGPQPKVPESVEFLLKKLQLEADATLIYQNIDTVARLSDTEVAVVYCKLKDIFGRRLNMADLAKR
jgi:hypothetical protein